MTAMIIAGWLPMAVMAAGLTLEGTLTQGGLVIGKTDPGARVSINGSNVRVSSDGQFLIGFGRDAKSDALLHIRHPSGGLTEKTLKVSKRQYKAQRINGMPPSKVTPSPEDLKRIRGDNAKIGQVRRRDTDRVDFSSGFRWPAAGPISGVFGSRRILNGKPKNPHNGIDVAAPRGAQIVAPAGGIVALAQEDMFYTGKTVMIDHGHGLTSVYAHMDKINVTQGQHITKGTAIGTIGKTGRVTGPHLHWGVTLFGTHLDPALLAGSVEKMSSR
ncbi:MAG: M23 family metallopeptidase [Rhodospirillales bacterium]